LEVRIRRTLTLQSGSATALDSSGLFVVSVPVIVENQCRTYTYSIQLHSPSPLTSPLHATGVEHYLLYREAAVNKIWKSISLYGRVDHRVFGLEPDTLYDFVVMACDSNCECQVSNMVTMKTERSAYWSRDLHRWRHLSIFAISAWLWRQSSSGVSACSPWMVARVLRVMTVYVM